MPLTREQALERARAWLGDRIDPPKLADIILAIQRETARECRQVARAAEKEYGQRHSGYHDGTWQGGEIAAGKIVDGIEALYPDAFTEDPTDDA